MVNTARAETSQTALGPSCPMMRARLLWPLAPCQMERLDCATKSDFDLH